MKSLPSEIWTNIAQHLRQPLPPPGQDGVTKADLHQQDLVNLMRVSTTTHHATAPVLYSEIVVDDISRLYVGVGKHKQHRLQAAPTDDVSNDQERSACAIEQKQVSRAVGPINKLDLLRLVKVIHYVYFAPDYNWAQLLRSNRDIQSSGVPLQDMFPQLERQTFCSWVWPTFQLAQQRFEYARLGRHIDNDPDAVVYKSDVMFRARYDFATGQCVCANSDPQMAVTVPVPVSAYRCVSQQAEGALTLGDIGREWQFHPANQVAMTDRQPVNAVHDVDIASPGLVGHLLVPGIVNHIYPKQGTVKDKAVSTQWNESDWESLVLSIFRAGDLWGTNSDRREEIKRTRVIVYLPLPRSCRDIYHAMGIQADEDLDRVNTIIRNREIKLGDHPIARVLAPREVKQRITVAWAIDVPWCMACKRRIQAIAPLWPSYQTSLTPAPCSAMQTSTAEVSIAADDDDFFFDFGESEDEFESDEEV